MLRFKEKSEIRRGVMEAFEILSYMQFRKNLVYHVPLPIFKQQSLDQKQIKII